MASPNTQIPEYRRLAQIVAPPAAAADADSSGRLTARPAPSPEPSAPQLHRARAVLRFATNKRRIARASAARSWDLASTHVAGPCAVEPAQAAARPPPSRVYAALDLGTNNCRLLIARPAYGGAMLIDNASQASVEGLLNAHRVSYILAGPKQVLCLALYQGTTLVVP